MKDTYELGQVDGLPAAKGCFVHIPWYLQAYAVVGAAAGVGRLLFEKGRPDYGCTSLCCCWRIAVWMYGKDHMPCCGVSDSWTTLQANRRLWSRVVRAVVLVRSSGLMSTRVYRFVVGIRMNATSSVAGAFCV